MKTPRDAQIPILHYLNCAITMLTPYTYLKPVSSLFSIQKQDLPLPALFRRAEATFQKLQAQQTPPISPSTQTQLINDALASLDRASLLVESLGLFSSNEDKDDLTTSEIKYLLIPYYKAEFLTQQHQNYISNRLSNTTESSGPTSGGDASVLNHQKLRLEALNSVPPLLENFLLQAQQYDLLSPGTLKCLSAVVRSGGKTPKIDASTLRELKIEKFKLEKSISARMEALLHRLGKSSINEEDNDDDDDSELAERELQILKIESAALKSIEALRAVRQEIEVLHHATNLSDEDRCRSTLSSSSQNSQHSNGDTQDYVKLLVR